MLLMIDYSLPTTHCLYFKKPFAVRFGKCKSPSWGVQGEGKLLEPNSWTLISYMIETSEFCKLDFNPSNEKK